jgi:hypothetical protein
VKYRDGTFGYEANGRRIRVFEAYIQAREAAANGVPPFPDEQGWAQEAMSTSDFPTYIGKFFRHRFLERWAEIQGRYDEYTRPFSVEDFEDYTSSRFGRFPDIPEKTPGGPYEEIALVEKAGPTLNLKEWGATFALTRKLVISDHLNKLTDLPNLAAEALARTISKEAAVNVWQANPTMWDGNAMFSSAHGNYGTTALVATTAGMDLLIVADQALSDQTDAEGYPIVAPGGEGRILMVPTELKWIANALSTLDMLPGSGSGTGASTSQQYPNQVKGIISSVMVEPYWTDANNWYLAADLKGEFAPLAQVTLNGETQPFIGLKDPGVRGVLGGDDPYDFEFDQIEWKIRADRKFIFTEWRGVYGSIVA